MFLGFVSLINLKKQDKSLGFEIIYNDTNTIKQIVLHYNVPGHWDFYKFRKCLFEFKSGKVVFTHKTPWKTLKSFKSLGPPLLVHKNRCSFGSTYFHGFERFIAQVSKNETIVSIIISKTL